MQLNPHQVYPETVVSRPWDRCPDPGLWHTTGDRLSAELEVQDFMFGLVRALQPGLVLETGAAHGRTALAIGRALRANKHGALVSLEIDASSVDVARKRVNGLPVVVWHGNSLDWAPPDEIDLAFFDSAFELRVQEFQRFRPHFRHGSIAVFHDVQPQWAPLGEQVEQALEDLGLRRITLPTPRGLTIAEVS